jgi:hypothetical protein
MRVAQTRRRRKSDGHNVAGLHSEAEGKFTSLRRLIEGTPSVVLISHPRSDSTSTLGRLMTTAQDPPQVQESLLVPERVHRP